MSKYARSSVETRCPCVSANTNCRRAQVGVAGLIPPLRFQLAHMRSTLAWCTQNNGSRAAYGTLPMRSEEHTSELQSLMRISYAVFCLKKKKKINRCTGIRVRHGY